MLSIATIESITLMLLRYPTLTMETLFMIIIIISIPENTLDIFINIVQNITKYYHTVNFHNFNNFPIHNTNFNKNNILIKIYQNMITIIWAHMYYF